jgi:putative Mn2+ efflux pump MntP
MLHGSRGACAAVFGNMTGFAILSSVSVAGLGALIAANAWLFDILKWIGGLYLTYLGAMMCFSQRQSVGVNEQIDSVKSLDGFQLYKRGLAVTDATSISVVIKLDTSNMTSRSISRVFFSIFLHTFPAWDSPLSIVVGENDLLSTLQ